MKKKKDHKTLYISIFWALFVVPLAIIIIIFVFIAQGKMGFLPEFKDLENPQNNLASEIYTADSMMLDKFFIENRTYVDYDDLSPKLIDALLATEDIRFYRHSGVDAKGLVRVVVKTILGGMNKGGGSTISQQLAKNLFNREIRGESKLARTYYLIITKFKEWNTAVRLERFYTKNEIMVMYLNTVPFGQEAYGIKSAARIFFNTTPDSLNIQEAAVLVGVLRAPTYYSPVLNPENSFQRRNVVINQMAKYDFISEETADSVEQLPIELNFNVQSHLKGLATHFRAYLKKTLMAKRPVKDNYYSYSSFQRDSALWEANPLYGWANKNFKPDGSNYDIYRDGLKIYTTIDYRMQGYAEEAIKKHLSETLQKEFFEEKRGRIDAPFSSDLEKEQIASIMRAAVQRTERYRKLRAMGASRDSIDEVFRTPREMKVFSWEGEIDTLMSPLDSLKYYKHILRTGFMAMEPTTGHVKAYVGDHNYRYFKYDHVTQGKRQVGSTVKPFLYILGMQYYSPCHLVPNVPVSFEVNDTIWTPKNSGNFDMEGKMVTLEWGLANSVQYISAWLVKRFNPNAVIEILKKMGIKSHIDPVPSVIYGTSDIKLEEMVGAYNTFVNKGVYIEPTYVTRIEDRHGNVISTFHPRQVEAISEKTAYLMIRLLTNVVNKGTAGRLRWFFNFEAELGGKTGTTQNHSDGWYMGIAPKLTAGVWVGAEDRSVHFDQLSKGSGSYMALPIYGYFMQKVYADSTLQITQEDIFEVPENFDMDLDCPDVEKEAGVIRENDLYNEPDEF